jgi:hypothetical protein
MVVEAAVMASLSFNMSALAPELGNEYVPLSQWSWWVLPAVAYSLFLLIGGCLVLNKAVYHSHTNDAPPLLVV